MMAAHEARSGSLDPDEFYEFVHPEDPGWQEMPDPEAYADFAHAVLNARAPEEAESDTFQLLGISELENMPPPSWLVHEVISEDGLCILYGEPGSGKSFFALDLALRVALSRDWHGAKTKRVGVLYIAGEGARGIGKRITGWRVRHNLAELDAPFAVLPVAVQVLDPGERAKLIRTIDEAKRRFDIEVGLIVLDTVSRSIAGEDENGQDTMTQFVQACDEIKRHAGGALLGIHHSGKDKERGMRGSSVLLGAVDASLRVTKTGTTATLKIEKQKDAEEGRPIHFELEKVTWSGGSDSNPADDFSTLVPIRLDEPEGAEGLITRDLIRQAFGLMADAWSSGKPLSSKPQTRRHGRFAPAIFASRVGGAAEAWEVLLMAWLDTGCIVYEVFDKKTKASGLRVVDPII